MSAETVSFNIRLPKDIVDDIDIQCLVEKRSRNNWLVVHLERYLTDTEKRTALNVPEGEAIILPDDAHRVELAKVRSVKKKATVNQPSTADPEFKELLALAAKEDARTLSAKKTPKLPKTPDSQKKRA